IPGAALQRILKRFGGSGVRLRWLQTAGDGWRAEEGLEGSTFPTNRPANRSLQLVTVHPSDSPRSFLTAGPERQVAAGQESSTTSTLSPESSRSSYLARGKLRK
ncbi:SDN1, partial [Symbiodinium sp. CCMP2456]